MREKPRGNADNKVHCGLVFTAFALPLLHHVSLIGLRGAHDNSFVHCVIKRLEPSHDIAVVFVTVISIYSPGTRC